MTRFKPFISVFASAALCASLVPCVAQAQASNADAPEDAAVEAPHVDGEVLVVYKDSASGERALGGAVEDELDATYGVEDVESVASGALDEGAADIVTLEDDADMGAAIEDLEAMPGVAYAQPNYTYELEDSSASTDEDPDQSKQYYLNAWDSTFTENCGANVTTAWSLVESATTATVAVLDTGCQVSHPDLAANLDTALAYDAVNDKTGATSVSDSVGHGTHVCGIIAAAADNGIGINGVTNNLAKVVPVKVFYYSAADSGYITDSSKLVQAYSYLSGLMQEGSLPNFHLINLSIGGYENNVSEEEKRNDEALKASIKTLREKGVLTVAAGGNGSNGKALTSECFPGDYEECLCVTSLSKKGYNSTFSDYNASKDISAPGEDIYSTYKSSQYSNMDGTSMATPLVTGIAALLWADNSALTVDQVIESLQKTAHAVNTSVNDHTGLTGSAGAVDAAEALRYESTNFKEPVDFSEAELSLSAISCSYTGSELTPAVVVTCAGYQLVEGINYNVTYSNNVSVGTATVTVEGLGRYHGSVSTIFEITQADVADAAFALSQNVYSFTGQPCTPQVTGALGDFTLTQGTDYTVEYEDNTAVGTAAVVITGCGQFAGTVRKEFTIAAASVAAAQFELQASSFTYSGEANEPTVTGTWNGKQLAEGTDYTVAYANNVNAGTATVTVTGKGSFEGSTNLSFAIRPASLANAQVSLPAASYEYTGKALCPVPAVTLNGTPLLEGTDYTCVYVGNIKAGTAFVVATGTGNYVDSAFNTFTITKTPLAVGSYILKGKARYQVVSNKAGKMTVRLVSCKSRSRTWTLPAKVTDAKGFAYSVVGIKARAFKGSKVRYLKIKTKRLSKARVKKCLKSSRVTKVKVPASKKKTYKKFFAKKVCGKKVRFK